MKDDNLNSIKVIDDPMHELLFYEIDTGDDTVFIIPNLWNENEETSILPRLED